MELQTCLLQALADVLDEFLDIGVATLLVLAVLFLDMVARVVLDLFQA